MKPDVIDEIMTASVVKIEESETLKAADNLMNSRSRTRLVVTKDNVPISILRDRDIWGKNLDQTIKEAFKENGLKTAVKVPIGTIVGDKIRQEIIDNSIIVVTDSEGKVIYGVVTADDMNKLIQKRIQQYQY